MDRTVGKAGCNFNRYSRGDNARQQKQVGYFGITSFEVLNAINPDYFIMSLYGNTLGKNYLDELRNVMKYKFNVEVDSFYVGDMEQDAYSLDKLAPIEYIHLGQLTVDKG